MRVELDKRKPKRRDPPNPYGGKGKPKLPEGWFRGRPKKNGIYRTSTEAIIKDGKVWGWGYAEYDGRKGWRKYMGWGNHIGAKNMIWRIGSP